MFNIRPNAPKAYETQRPNSGALALLMKALGGVGEGAAGISKSAGTSVAEDKLAALTPEERQGKNISDKFQGLALTEQFKNKLAQTEKDATAAEVLAGKQDFTTKRDKTLHGYNMSRDRLKEKNSGKGKSDLTPEEDLQGQTAIGHYDNKIMEYETAVAANDTQDGIGLGQKLADVQTLKREKYNLLKKMGYNEKTAREMTYTDSSMTKKLHDRILGNVYKDKDK